MHDAVSLDGVPLAEELSQDLILCHLAVAEFGVEGHIVDSLKVIDSHSLVTSLVELGICLLDKSTSALINVAADASEELVVVDLAIVILVEELEDAFELGGRKDVTVFTESPLELCSIKLLVLAVINSAEDLTELTDAMGTTSLKGGENLFENLIGRLTSYTEHGVDIGVVTAAHSCDGGGELLVIKLAVAVCIELGEDSLELDILEDAAECLKSFLEFTKLNRAESIKIEVLKDLFNGLALIISPMCALSDFLENDVLKLLHSVGGCLDLSGSGEAPCLQDEVNEVIVFLCGKGCVNISVVSDETLLSHVATSVVLAEAVNELNTHVIALLFSRSHSGVLFSLVGGLELAPGNAAGTTLVQ